VLNDCFSLCTDSHDVVRDSKNTVGDNFIAALWSAIAFYDAVRLN